MKKTAVLALGLILAVSLFLCGLYAWATEPTFKEISPESFEEFHENLSIDDSVVEYCDEIKSVCRNAIEEYYGGEVLDDYISVWSDNGWLNISYFWQDAKACYEICTGGDANAVAVICSKSDYYKQHGLPFPEVSATFDGVSLELHLN